MKFSTTTISSFDHKLDPQCGPTVEHSVPDTDNSVESKFYEHQVPLNGPSGENYMCGWLKARVWVSRQEGVADSARVTLSGLGKDFDPWLAWGECEIDLLASGGEFHRIEDPSKPSGNPHWKVDRKNPDFLCGEWTITEPSGLYDLIQGIKITVLDGWHRNR